MVARNHERILLDVVQREGIYSVEVFEEVQVLLAVEGEYDFAIGARLKLVLVFVFLSDFLMVIYFSIHCEHLLPVRRDKRLSA